MQFIFGLIVLRWEVGRMVLKCVGDKVTTFLDYTAAGSGFVYGFLVTDQNDSGISLGTVFAFKVRFNFYYKSKKSTENPDNSILLTIREKWPEN